MAKIFGTTAPRLIRWIYPVLVAVGVLPFWQSQAQAQTVDPFSPDAVSPVAPATAGAAMPRLPSQAVPPPRQMANPTPVSAPEPERATPAAEPEIAAPAAEPEIAAPAAEPEIAAPVAEPEVTVAVPAAEPEIAPPPAAEASPPVGAVISKASRSLSGDEHITQPGEISANLSATGNPPSARLKAARLGLDSNLVLGQPLPKSVRARASCFSKSRVPDHEFCTVPVAWGSPLDQLMVSQTVLYTGSRALVRLHKGVIDELYAAFPSSAFPRIAAHYGARLGAPQIQHKQPFTGSGGDSHTNTRIGWQQPKQQDAAEITLELYRHDSYRTGFPDSYNGSIRVYRKGDTSLFRQVSSLDFLTKR